MSISRITSPDDLALAELATRLASMSGSLDLSGEWPAEQLALCGQAGVYEWFVPEEWGGQGWSEAAIVRGYLQLSAACLVTTFILTQWAAACRRIVVSQNDDLKSRLLPGLVGGQTFATVGISHLTTSRRHLKNPVLVADETNDGFVLDGFSPWVTGAMHADVIVVGANLKNGRQVLLAMPTDLPGVDIPEPLRLVGVSASHTGEVRCRSVQVPREFLLAGPSENVMTESGTRTGGLQTSTLAIGMASAAIRFIGEQAQRRADLLEVKDSFESEHKQLEADLLALAGGQEVCSNEDLRARANSLALRSSQAALAAAKGTGYVLGHPAGRWCREALFFLVWSCPQPVITANLCELAGINE